MKTIILGKKKYVIKRRLNSKKLIIGTFLLLDSFGNKFILKKKNKYSWYSKKQIQNIKYILKKLYCYKTSVQIPKIVCCDSKNSYIVLNYLAGLNLTNRAIPQKNVIELIQFIDFLHSFRFGGFGYINYEKMTGDYSDFDVFLGELKKDVIKFGRTFNIDCSGFNKQLRGLKEKEIKRGSILHADLKENNIIFDPKNKKIGIIDWNNLFLGPPLIDYAILLNRTRDKKIKEIVNSKFKKDERRELNIYRIVYLMKEILWREKNGLAHKKQFKTVKSLLDLQKLQRFVD